MSQRPPLIHANSERFWAWLMALAERTEPDRPYTRRSFTPRFDAGRDWLRQQMQALNLVVSVDAAGNLIGRQPGTQGDLGTLVIGSHSDSVPGGGRFDGMAGIIAGLECVARLQELGYQPRHAIEVVDFLAEEPSEWGISCVGSRGITGFLDAHMLTTPHPQSGETLAAAITRIGGRPDALTRRRDVAACLELHIEQGAVLEHEALDIGVVSSIVGILRLTLSFTGQAAHAGTTPMDIRRDALVAANRTAWLANQQALALAERSGHYLTATVGQITVQPGASNVVPRLAQLVFDIRSDDRSVMDQFASQLEHIAQESAQLARVALSQFERMTDTHPTQCDTHLMALIANASDALGLRHRRMPSGAGHDAAFMAHIAPTAMVFVPSEGGRSHSADEWTSPEQFAKGVSVLINTVLAIDQGQR